MKIVDLLNRIANKEEVPYKIKYNGNIYEFDGETENYLRPINLGMDFLIGEDIVCLLNDEVEIIEEPKKVEIPKYIPNEVIQDFNRAVCPGNIKCVAHKVNEIINYLQYKEKRGAGGLNYE